MTVAVSKVSKFTVEPKLKPMRNDSKNPPSDKIVNAEGAVKKPTTTRKSLGVVRHIDRPQPQVAIVNYDVSNQRSHRKPESAFGKNYEKMS